MTRREEEEEEEPQPRRRARSVAGAVAGFGLLTALGLLARVALEDPERDAAPPAAEPEPEPAKPHPVRPFAVDGARALPTQLPPLAAVELRPGELPTLAVRGLKLRAEGHVTWLDDPVFETLRREFSPSRSDGASLYYALSRSGDHRGDLLIRDGEVYTDVLRQLGVEVDDLRCHDVRNGRLLLVSGSSVGDELTAWLFDHGGPIQRLDLGVGTRDSFGCEAHLDDAGRFVVQADRKAIWDGARLTYAVAATKLHAATRFGTSPACAPACTPYEADPKTRRFADQIGAALDCAVHLRLEGPWLLGQCRDPGGPVARAALDGPCCDHERLPADHERLPATLTRTGDALLRFSDRTFQLWGTDGALGPRTPLDDLDDLNINGPAMLLRGLPDVAVPSHDTTNPPSAATPWVEPLRRYGALRPSGASVDERDRDSPERRRRWREMARSMISEDTRKAAAAAFGENIDLIGHGSVVVDGRCGHVVWLDKHYGFGPSADVTVSPRPTRAPECRRVADFASFPGIFPDTGKTLIARTPRGELAIAWRPPVGDDSELRWEGIGRADKPPPPPFRGWRDLGVRGALDDDPSWGALDDVATVLVDDQRLVLNGARVHTLPADARPLRVRTNNHLLAAHNDKLIVCVRECRSIDPGLGRPITAAVLLGASPTRLLVRAGGDAHGLVHSDAPSQELPAHPFAATLRMHLKERDNEREAFHAAFDAWVTEVKLDAKAVEEAKKRKEDGG